MHFKCCLSGIRASYFRNITKKIPPRRLVNRFKQVSDTSRARLAKQGKEKLNRAKCSEQIPEERCVPERPSKQEARERKQQQAKKAVFSIK